MSLNRQTYKLPSSLAGAVAACIGDWKRNNKVARLWQRDASLWTGTDESNWLGWLTIVEEQLAHLEVLKKIATDVKKARFRHVLLLGMGGSSLCPEVLRMTFGKIKGFPELHVLDSTDPAQIKAIEAKVDLKRTICIVSSKSGSTLEPNIYKQYFFERIKAKVGEKEVGSRFIAITDPGSKLQQVAEADKFRKIFFGVPSIGGRYSALSNFGMVPAAVMGLDVAKFLPNAKEMVQACGATSAADVNPGVILGAILGVAANQGRDKLTIITSPGIFDLGAWLEQLIAESTGKVGKGIIPVDRERLAKPAGYGNDRVFAYLRLASKPNKAQDAAVEALEKAGHPVVRITLPNIYNLGQEFRDVEAHHSGGDHAEIGKCGKPSSDARHAKKNLTEFVGFRHLLHLRARVGNRDEAVARFLFSHLGLDALKEILFVDIWLQRAPRFTGDDANRAPEIDLCFDGFDLRGIGGVQHVKLGESLDLPKSHAQNFRT